jgi:ABC-type transport system involved in cytochrome c biogenesis permease subunit
MELTFRNGIGSLAASAIAFPTLLIAHFLANTTPGGDTMAMLQAVLDTNIWLATHVVVITLGYSATALAWILGLVYVIGGLFTPAFADADAKKTMSRMIYGTVCFAMLFSFVGTILGGIWADQSWGRFWGWDPKENGAVLIVIWNAIVLHARWAGLVRERGLANLAIFGGVITAWSWFGTNMLGVGLHSYGFMDSALVVLCAYVAVQLLFIAIGSLPTRLWRSYPELAK